MRVRKLSRAMRQEMVRRCEMVPQSEYFSGCLIAAIENLGSQRANFWRTVWLAVFAMFFAAGPVAAETGACEIESGMWASPAEACTFANQPEEAEKRFGDRALLRWERGVYVYQGVTCGIFDSKLSGNKCELQIECGRFMGRGDVQVSSSREMKFGRGPDAPTYVYCGKSKAAD